MGTENPEEEQNTKSALYCLSWSTNSGSSALGDAMESEEGEKSKESEMRLFLPAVAAGTNRDFEESARLEVEWLKSCAFRLDLENYRSPAWDVGRQQKATEILSGGDLFKDAVDNLAALKSLMDFLATATGSRLPQIAKQRIAARRLFLEVCRAEVPEHFRNDAVYRGWTEEFLPDLGKAEEFIRKRLKESEAATFERIRDLIVADEPLPQIIQDSALMAVCRGYRDLQLGREDGRDFPSIQSLLIKYYLANGFSEIVSQYTEAKISSRKQLFKHAAELVLGEQAADDEFDPEEALLRTAIIANPFAARNREECVDYLFEGLGEGGWRFLHDFANEVKKAEERKHRIKTDLHTLVLARHWVDPHCPLWLMSKGAMQVACRALSTGGEWSDARVDERLGKGILVQCARQPIRGVNIVRPEPFGEGYKIKGFDVLKSVFPALVNALDEEIEIAAWSKV